MELADYRAIISNLPVMQQCFTTKRLTWRTAEEKVSWLNDFNNNLFQNQKTINISRQDIFNSQNSIRELILKTIYWGYPNGMRGNHFVDIMQKIQILETCLSNFKKRENLKTQDFDALVEILKDIRGLGLSTYSKLLYFLNIEFNDSPCLILDQRLVNVFKGKFYNDYFLLKKISDYNKESHYLTYIDLTNKISIKLNTKGENIEQFLFMFGNNLKM